jgi:hypothetical protein
VGEDGLGITGSRHSCSSPRKKARTEKRKLKKPQFRKKRDFPAQPVSSCIFPNPCLTPFSHSQSVNLKNSKCAIA